MKEKHIRHYFRLQLEIRLRLQPRLPHLLLHKLEFNLNHVILQPNHLADLKKKKTKNQLESPMEISGLDGALISDK